MISSAARTLNLTNVEFKGWAAASLGGAIYGASSGQVANFNNVTFDNNRTTGAGGGALWFGSTGAVLTFTGPTVFISNTAASSPMAGNGGAILGAVTTKATFTGSTLFQNNFAAASGAAIYATGTVTINGPVAFISNTTWAVGTNTQVNGGAICENVAATVNINGAYFSGNTVRSDITAAAAKLMACGGALYFGNAASKTTVTSGTFFNNNAYGSIDPSLTGIPFAAIGGAVFNENALFTGDDLLFDSNHADSAGGAIFSGYDRGSGASTLTLSNVVFTNNSAGLGGGIASMGGVGTATASGVETIAIASGTFSGNKAYDLSSLSPSGLGSGVPVNGNGGAAYLKSSGGGSVTATFNDVTFLNNSATSATTGGMGGALFLSSNAVASVNITSAGSNITDSGNTAYGAGAAADASKGGFAYLENNSTLNFNIDLGKTLTIGSAASAAADSIIGDATTIININSDAGNASAPAGAVVLHADNSANNAAIIVSAGALLLGNGNAKLRGGFDVKSHATIGGLGTLTPVGTLTISSGAILQVGYGAPLGSGASGNLLIDGNLTLQNGYVLNYGVYGHGNGDLLTVANTLFQTPGAAGTINLNTTFQGSLSGTYALINALGSSGLTTSNFSTTSLSVTFSGGTLAPDTDYHFNIDNNFLYLILGDIGLPPPPPGNNVLTWTGNTGDGAWSGVNWTAAGSGTTFLQGDIINLDGSNSAAHNAINIDLATTATVAGMYVSGNQSYTVTGAGLIGDSGTGFSGAAAANGRLTLGSKSPDDASASVLTLFTGTLTLANDSNTFRNGVTINSGELVVNPFTLDTGDIGITNNGVLTFVTTRSGTYGAPLKGAGTVNYNIGGANNSLMLMAANPSFTGASNVNSGWVYAEDPLALGTGPVNIADSGTLTYNTSGALANNFSGDGTLDARGTLTLSGSNTITHIILGNTGSRITIANSRALGTAATQVTLRNTELSLAVDGIATGNVTMTGTSSIAFPSTLATAKATFASLTSVGADSSLAFNADLGAGISNLLTVTGAVTGTYNVSLNFAPNAPASPMLAIPLIKAGSVDATYILNGDGTVVFANDPTTYFYSLSDAGGLTLLVKNIERINAVSASIITNVTSALPLTWFAELDTVEKRFGDIRLNQRDNPSMELWMRGYAQRLNVDNQKDIPAAFNEDQAGTEIGLDYGGSQEGHDYAFYIGGFLGYGSSSRDVTDMPDAVGNTNSIYGGVYVNYIHSDGVYVSAVGKYNHFKTQFSALAIDGPMNGAYNNDALGGSVEVGRHFELGRNWYWTLSGQGALASITSMDTTTDSGIKVSQGTTTTRQVRGGVLFGRKFETSAGGIIQPYAKVYVAQQWTSASNLVMTFSGNDKVFGAPEIKGARVDAGLGVNIAVMKNLQIYADFERAWAQDYTKPYGLTLGANYAW